MSSSFLVRGKKIVPNKYKLFCPSTHLWIHAVPSSPSSSSMPLSKNKFLGHDSWKVDVGITHRGLDDIGDISSIESCYTIHKASFEGQHASSSSTTTTKTTSDKKDYNQLVQKGDEILRIHWDGHLISHADELYHTVWDTISDSTSIRSPLDGILSEIHVDLSKDNNKLVGHGIDSDVPLFTLWTDEECIQRSFSSMMHAEDYNHFVAQKLEKGRFYDPDR